MKCPNCGTPDIPRMIRCRSCGEVYATQDLLALHQLEFLLEETAAWEVADALRLPYVERLEELQARLPPHKPVEPAAAPASGPAPALEPVVAEAAPGPARKPAAAKPKPVAPPPPRDKVPFDQWLLSERNIKVALYSGALLLVIAGMIFVGVNWARIPGPAKFTITLMLTGLMYLGGYLLFRRPAFRIGGIALLGVASGFVIVNFAILQFYVLGPAGLRDDVMWLIASPLCLVLYLLTAYWTRGDLFTYISLVAVFSTVTAALVVLDVPLLAFILAYALLALAVLPLARAVQGTPVADFTRLPLLIVSQAAMPLVIVAALIGWTLLTNCSYCNEGSPWLAILALVLGVLFYAATNTLFKWMVARWAAAILLPVAVALALFELGVDDTVSGLLLMVLALAYLGAGYALERREKRREGGGPLYVMAYVVAFFVTVMATPQIDSLYKVLFGDVILLVVSAAIYRSYWWIYGAVWLFMLPVYLVIYQAGHSLVYQGLLMGLLGLNYAVAGYVLGRRSLRLGGPFLTAAAFLSVVAVGLTWGNPVVAGLVLGAVATLYLLAALWLDWPWLLLPALLAVHLVVFTVNYTLLTGGRTLPLALTISYAVLGLLLGLGGLVLRRLGQDRWVWPLYLVGGLDVAGSYFAGLVLDGPLAVGLSVLVAVLLLSFAWLERAEFVKRKLPPILTYLGTIVIFIGHFYVPHLVGIDPVIDGWPPIAAALCTLFVILAWLLRREPLADLYGTPLRRAGLALMAIPLVGSIGLSLLYTEPLLLAATFAIAGLTYGLDGALRRAVYFIYLGIGAMVVVIWGIFMALRVSELQAYVFPVGLALLGIAWNARRRGWGTFHRWLTLLGLIVLMGSAFVQSFGRGNWPYALLLLVEGLVSVSWGIRHHLRGYVRVGVLALIINGVVQLGPALLDLSGWIQLGLAGTVLFGGGMLALIKREEVLAARRRFAKEWRQWET